ncbi:MAG: hypothetical protein II458_05890 [Oscillospiraceae bacterium]|nr:hypothetical protein [Oscillospiraceae bacterium]
MENKNQPNLLVFGILSLVLEWIPGIILGAIGRKKGNEYIAQGGTLTGAAKVGYILSKVGFVLGIIGTIFVVIYIILIVAGVASGAFNYSSF